MRSGSSVPSSNQPTCSARTRRAATQLPIPRWPRRNTDLSGVARREHDREGGTLPGRALHGDPSTVRRDDLPGDVEAEPQTTVRRGRDGALEPTEDAVGVLRRDPDAAIADDERGAPVPGFDDDVDGLP